MTITIAEAKAFITNADRSRENWLTMAKRSWDEIKKRQRNGKLWGVTPSAVRRRAKYPAWYSIFKIRQSLVLSRLGIPLCRDMTQDGKDTIGATAAILRERLAVNLAKSFPMFDAMCSNRDDFLVTNFALCRAYYERDEVKQRVKEYIVPEKVITSDGSEDVVFIDSNGKEVESDDIHQDDTGYFLYKHEVIDVENERICLEPMLYKDVYIDPNIRRWARCKRIAFECHYSEPEFKEIFGVRAFNDLSNPDIDPQDESQPKQQTIKVFEYWDYYERECYWFAENGSDFIKPKGYMTPSEYEENETGEVEALNGLYNLDNFFPCPPPLMMNSPTDEFWPVPEYLQLMEILDEIHSIFGRMMETTRAYRSRLLFDSSIEGLAEGIKEMPEAGAIGITNLTQALVQAGGDIKNVAQYIPVDGIIQSLQQLYISLEQRLNTLWRMTATSDMLQGLAADNTQRTFGERQMTEKYALNQLEEPQRKMQEYVRDCYELITEMALKNFKDESLEVYMMPSTLQPKDQENYRAALGMLKDNTKRFRIDLETDSTIALNEQYDKQMRIELTTTLTSAIKEAAAVTESSPSLAVIMLHNVKYLIQGFRQGKLFQSEITEAIDNVIEQAEEAAMTATPPFDKDQVMAQLAAQELKAKVDLDTFKAMNDNQLAQMQLAQTERLAGIKAQLESMKINAGSAKDNSQAQMDYQQLVAGITKSREELAFRREELMLEYQKVASEAEVAKYKVMLDERFGTVDAQLAQTQQFLEKQYQEAEMQERWATEQRLQAEHSINEALAQVNMLTQMKKATEQTAPQVQQVSPGVTIEAPKPVPTTVKTTKKVELDKKGRVVKMENTNSQTGA
jgi:hypothetical protein